MLLMIMAVIFLLPNYANAALQSNGGTPSEYDVNAWITGIRQMQTARTSTWFIRYNKWN